jgi:hypothetical protein
MAESYLKMKVQADRQLALALTKALREIHATNMSTIENCEAWHAAYHQLWFMLNTRRILPKHLSRTNE